MLGILKKIFGLAREKFGRIEKKSETIEKEKMTFMAKCGHETKLEDKVSAFGETITITMNFKADNSLDYCHKCLGKMAARCAWCGKPIFIGGPITLYTPKETFKIPEYAVKFSENPTQLVGCPRTSCAETGADYAGFWIPPGKVKRFPSMIERSLMDMAQGGDGIVIMEKVSDLSKF